MRYLQTGNNQGLPWLDQRFAAYVGVSAPQARALADNYIESCDRVLDDRSAAAAASSAARATSAARASSAARERATASQRAAAIDAYQDRSCAAIGGRRVGDRCESTVIGNPSGLAGSACVSSAGVPVSVLFDGSGAISANSYSTSRRLHPGCFR